MYKYIIIIIGLIGLDALTKHLASNYLSSDIILITNFVSLSFVKNTGIAFSIPLTGLLLKIITVILIFGIFWYYWTYEKPRKSRVLNIGYMLIFAGALSNAWERIFVGYVVDFISVEYFSVFNLADSYITLGACGVIYYHMRYTS